LIEGSTTILRTVPRPTTLLVADGDRPIVEQVVADGHLVAAMEVLLGTVRIES